MISGIDPSNRMVGLAVLDDGPVTRPPPLRLLTSIPGFGGDAAPRTARRVASVLGAHLRERAPLGGCRIRIEKAPGRIRDEVEHGSQADVGFKLGRITGQLEVRLEAWGTVELVEVSTWRARMLEVSSLWGVPAAPPPKAPPPAVFAPVSGDQRKRFDVTRSGAPGGFLVTWRGCGHETPVRSFEELQRFNRTACGACAAGAEKRPTVVPADWRRAMWKKLACDLVRAHWPEAFGALVDVARQRARAEKADHELSGISDACESVWIGVSQLT